MLLHSKELNQLLTLAESAAKTAAMRLEAVHDKGRGVVKEVGRDLQVRADRVLEQAIIERLKSGSDFPILSEESRQEIGTHPGTDPIWIVDPLDGSINHSRGLDLCCISIALWHDSEPLLGVIFDFNKGDLYTGLVREGAWLNGQTISIGQCNDPGKALLATGFPVKSNFGTPSLAGFVKAIQQYKKIRMIGSAALSLAYVACGKVDAYWERDIMLWDVSAGLAIVQSAGGVFVLEEGRHPLSRHVLATNSRLLCKTEVLHGLI